METPSPIGMWEWAILFLATFFGLAWEYFHNKRHPAHEYKYALSLTIQMIAFGLLFGIVVYFLHGPVGMVEYYAGYLTEKSLSIDNLFVFLMLFTGFKIKGNQQHIVLAYGVIGAMLLRGVFIAAGAAIIHNYHWILWVFGLYLAKKGIDALRGHDDESDVMAHPIVKFIKKLMPVSEVLKKNEESKILVWRSSWLMGTRLLFVIIIVEIMDLVFAVDSVPAIFSITDNAFIVYASNIWAILGLRALFFVLEPKLGQLPYMAKAMGIILTFIGVKMLTPALFALLALFGITHFPEAIHLILNEEFEMYSNVSLFILTSIIVWAGVMSYIHRNDAPKVEDEHATH